MRLLMVDINGTITSPISGEAFVPENDPTAIKLIPGVARALNRYRNDGWAIIGVSNQSGIAAGRRTFGSVIQEMQYTLYLASPISYIFFCPDFAGRECWKVQKGSALRWQVERRGLSYRKPDPGMLQLAMEGGDFEEFLMVGDHPEDRAAALAADIPFLAAEDFRSA